MLTLWSHPLPAGPNFITFDQEKGLIETPAYRYLFDQNNQMMFKDISIKSAGNWVSYARDAHLLIFADLRHFFPLTFDETEIVSHIIHHEVYPFFATASLSFYLKILFFRIHFDLVTEVTFSPHRAFIPMKLTMPVEAAKYLTSQSAMLYRWQMPGISLVSSLSQVPRLTSPTRNPFAESDFAELRETALAICGGQTTCAFRLVFTPEGNPRLPRMSMNLKIKKALVQRGFFPMWVDSVAGLANDFKWQPLQKKNLPKNQEGDLPPPSEVGFLFNTSGLEKGVNEWDFDLSLGT